MTVTGTATGPDGKPVKGATVRLGAGPGGVVEIRDRMWRPSMYHGGDGRNNLEIVASATTDESGRYRFDNVDARVFEIEGQTTYCNVSVTGTAPNGAVTWSDTRTTRFPHGVVHPAMQNGPIKIDLSFGAYRCHGPNRRRIRQAGTRSSVAGHNR